ncbi:MAG: AAA family ATPase [Terriglobia bacterium]
MPLISRLDVADFRGVPRPGTNLIFDNKSILLFGENGTGKSSFVDAIEKLLCGRVTTLDGRAQGISSDIQGPHIRAGASGSSISIVFSKPDFTFDLGTEASGTPNGLAPYLNAAKEDLFILRRRDILNFIDSQPRNRYGYLRPFLPLSGVQEVEDAMKEAKDKANRNLEKARARQSELAEFISKPLGIIGEPTKPIVVAAISRTLAGVGHQTISTWEEIPNSLNSLDQELDKFGDTAVAGKLLNAISALRELSDAGSPETLTHLIEACKKLREREATEAKVFYDSVLEDGIKWMREESRITCPLCENPIDSAITIAKAQARLDSMRDLITLRSQASSSLTRANASVRAMTESAARAVRALKPIEGPTPIFSPRPISELSAVLAQLDRELQKSIAKLDLEALEHSANALRPVPPEMTAIANLITGLQRALDALPSPDRAKLLLSTRQRIRSEVEGWDQFESATALREVVSSEARQADAVYQLALEARKEVVQQIFDELSQEIDRFYAWLHPDESHGRIRLEVRETGQASAYLRCSFYGRTDVDPRGYYSDAHLDTLGISIFLALRRWHRKLKPEFNLLVLDDILTSIDNAHAVRLSELLLKEFSEYQILLTTHDRIWFEHFQDIQARCRVSANYVNKVIHKWTIDEGPDLREPKDERDRVNKLLEDGTAGEIASMAGRLLEHILQEMRYGLSLSVHAKRSERYEIGELWPPFYKKVRQDYPTFYVQIKIILDAIDLNWPIRNWVGAHFNEWTKHASREETVRFGEAVAGLFDAVYCPQCRKFITPSITPLGQLSCRCPGGLIYPAPGGKGAAVVDRAELVKESDAALRDARFDTSLYFEQKRAETSREQ